MKQTRNFTIYTSHPPQTIKQNNITNQAIQSSMNPECDKNKSNEQNMYCNPAVHLKKNFLKFTKAASTTSAIETNHFQPHKQQSKIKEKANIMMTNSIQESVRFFREENRILKQKVELIEKQLQHRLASIVQKDKQLNELVERVNLMQNQIYGLSQKESKLTSLVNYYKSVSSRCKICKETDQKYQYLQQKYEEMSQISKQLQQILQTKDLLLQNTIKAKNDQYKSALTYKSNQIKSLDLRISVLEKENQRLCQELSRPNLVKEDQSIRKFQKIGAQFQLRIGEVVDQNIKLKNTINNLTGKIDQLNSKNYSLQNTIKAYQGCEQLYNGSKTKSQLESLRTKIEAAKEQYDNMASKYDFQILKLQNAIAQKKIDDQQTLLNFSDSERLRQALMNAIWEIQTLRSKAKEVK